MIIRNFLFRFLITFGVTLMATVLVTLFWNYFITRIGLIIDWETSLRMSLAFAIVIPLTQIRNK
jgi:hypothetical protein